MSETTKPAAPRPDKYTDEELRKLCGSVQGIADHIRENSRGFTSDAGGSDFLHFLYQCGDVKHDQYHRIRHSGL